MPELALAAVLVLAKAGAPVTARSTPAAPTKNAPVLIIRRMAFVSFVDVATCAATLENGSIEIR
jgi:hypothetical protein